MATRITCLKAARGESDDLFEVFEPLLSVLLWLAERAGVGVTLEVLVQVFLDEFEVPVLEPAVELVEEDHRRGFRSADSGSGSVERGRHLDEATGGGGGGCAV